MYAASFSFLILLTVHECYGEDEVSKISSCLTSQFECTEGKQCIPNIWLCDGVRDCMDGTDEQNCGSKSISCLSWDFECAGDQRCIPYSWLCDGDRDCTNGTDEQNCGEPCATSNCSQKCKSTPSGPQCYCKEGYLLDKKDLKSCLDINECLEEGTCSHNCSNLPGTYKCSCLGGYRLVNTSCLAKGPNPILLFSSLNEIRSLDLRSGEYKLVRAAVRAAAVDADYTNERIYWTDITNKSAIYSLKMDGTDVRTALSHGLLIPEDIAIDDIAGNFYITDSGLKQVLACKMDGTMCHVLHSTNINKPRSIVVDPSEGLMYWSDWSETFSGIYRSGMDGSSRITFVSKNVSWPNGIAIDRTIQRLYWADAKRNTIEYITLDGSIRKALLGGIVHHPYSLAVFEDFLYWSDWSTFSLESCNKFTGKQRTLRPPENDMRIIGIYIYHSVLASKMANPCLSNDCSHMCLITPTRSYVCACPFGLTLDSDAKNCKLEYEFPSLFVTDGYSVYYIIPEAVGREAVKQLTLPLTSALISSVAFDSQRKTLFVADLNAPAIHGVNMSSLNTWQLVQNEITSPKDMAFDANSRNLFWVDSSRGTVEVMSVELQRRAVLIKGLINPVAIAISSLGYMFVAKTGAQSITMCDMDGSNQRVIPSIEGFPLSLAVHPKESLLYWVNPMAGTISVLNFKISSDPQIIVKRLDGVMSVAVSNDYVYWTVSKRELHLLNNNITECNTLTHVLELPGQDKERVLNRKVSFSPGSSSTNIHPCTLDNGGCSYLCILCPNGKCCVCQNGMVLSADNLTCVDSRQSTCSLSQYRCDSDGSCIDLALKCDRKPDCGDGSDEEGCSDDEDCSAENFKCVSSGVCLSSEFHCDGQKDCDDGSDEIGCEIFCSGDDFKCRNGKCILNSWLCDKRDDCGDGSDEENCSNLLEPVSCAVDQLMCASGECISVLWRCDGEPDCSDGETDEANCNVTSCDPKSQKRCDNGQCVSISWVCDGSKDCSDGSDEKDCLYSRQRTCSPSQYRCESDGSCIDLALKCDSKSDCDDGSDEKGCSDATDCGEFFCYANNRCLEWSKVCDGVQDCPDLPDEDGACYWSCGKDNGGCNHRCQKTPRGSKCFCFNGFKLLSDNKTCGIIDECAEPGFCSHYCNNTKGGFKCSCAEGYILQHDRKSCKADGDSATLVYLLGDQIRGIDLVSHTHRVYINIPSADIRGMDYDAEEGIFYWTEGTDGTINSYSPETSRQDVLLRPMLKARRVKFDWIGKNIYFTDANENIQVCSKNGQYCRVLISVAMNIDSLDISPNTGQMFYTTSSIVRGQYSGFIERAEMDGSHRLVIISDKAFWPIAVTVDHVLKIIYWIDVKIHTVECANFHGLNRRQIIGHEVYHPYALTVFEDFVYFADWRMDKLIRCNKFSGVNCSSIRESNVKADILMVIHKVMQPRGETRSLGECPHLSLITRTGSACKCADGYVVRNGTCEFAQKTTAPLMETALLEIP